VSVIEATNLTKDYGDIRALESLSLSVDAGEVLGFLGPNGAGKSTTLRLLMGFARPTSGSATIKGFDATSKSVDVHRVTAYVPGEASLWPQLTGAETLALLANNRGGVDEQRQAELVEQFRFDPSRKVGTYSKGNRQKLLLIAAFSARAEVLLLDEPTDGLDPLMGDVFRSCVVRSANEGAAVLLSSHVLAEVDAVASSVAILRAGRLVDQGSLQQMRHLKATQMEITFAGDVPDVSAVPGVHVESIDGSRLRVAVVGNVEPLLKVLATSSVVQLLSHEPSLEEIFREHYEGDETTLRS